jgi:hypothetical protein
MLSEKIGVYFGLFLSKTLYTTCRIMTAAISFLLGYENVEQEDDSDASSSEDETIVNPNIILSKEDVYKVIWIFLHWVSTYSTSDIMISICLFGCIKSFV